jgi:Topoisomerase DNA binding C4 zinc finger
MKKNLRSQIENFLKKTWGEKYFTTNNKIEYFTKSIAFSRSIWGSETILMVVMPPIGYDLKYEAYFLRKDEPIRFFLYDRETELVFGCVSEISLADDWKKALFYKITTAQDRMERSECPTCGFWLLERTTQYGHSFMGCSGFPACTFSSEVDDIYDDEY